MNPLTPPQDPAGTPPTSGTPLVDPLARIRHDLLTPDSHILGYAEMLREQATELGLVPCLEDLVRIEAAGRQLVQCIRDDLHPERLPGTALAFRELHARWRTPLHHVTGYCALLLELAETGPAAALAPDLQKIQAAAAAFLRLMEKWLTPDRLLTRGTARPPVSPTVQPEALALAQPAQAGETPSPPGGRILVADDDPGHRDLLVRRLRQQGFAVEAVAGGEQALRRLRQEPFDLLLLDVLMPRPDGSQVLAEIKTDPALRELPVLMLSALDELDSVVRCILAGAEDYLAKPVNTVLLRARIGACLEKRRLRQQEAAYLTALEREQQKSEALLLNILPAPIAERLKRGETPIVDSLPEATVLFADLAGFTELAARRPSVEVVRLLDDIFSAFDDLARARGLEKIKTIGDAYMVVGGVPTPRPDHAEAVAGLALAMCAQVERTFASHPWPIRLRLGLHTGPVIAGIIGHHKFNYDLWGDTVNIASRMESHGLPGRIQVSEAAWQRLAGRFTFEPRGEIEVKGKGRVRTWWLTGRRHDEPPALCPPPGIPAGSAA